MLVVCLLHSHRNTAGPVISVNEPTSTPFICHLGPSYDTDGGQMGPIHVAIFSTWDPCLRLAAHMGPTSAPRIMLGCAPRWALFSPRTSPYEPHVGSPTGPKVRASVGPIRFLCGLARRVVLVSS